MKLKNNIIVTEKYKGRTEFDFWNNLEINDEIEISLVSEESFEKFNSKILIKNKNQNTEFVTTVRSAGKYLSKIKFKEI